MQIWVIILASICVVALLTFRSKQSLDSRERWQRTYQCLAICAGFAAICVIAKEILYAPLNTWNACYLAPSIAVSKGFQLYYPQHSGPVLNTIYTPLSALAHLPTMLANSPTAKVQIGLAISILYFLLPVIVLVWMRKQEGCDVKQVVLGLTGFVFLTELHPAMNLSAFTIRADQFGLMLGGLGIVLLAVRDNRRLWICSAVFIALAPFAKQTLAPLCVAAPIVVGLISGWRHAAKYTVVVGVVGLIGLIISLLVFDPAAFIFNVWTIPSSHPWWGLLEDRTLTPFMEGKGREYLIYQVLSEFVFYNLLWIGGLLALAVCDDKSGELGTRPRATWLPFVLAGLLVLPTAMLARIKYGGNMNNIAFPVYFLLLGLVSVGVDRWRESDRPIPGARTLAMGVLNLMLFIVIVPGLVISYRAWDPRAAKHNGIEAAYRFDRENPGVCYFPEQPIVALMGHGQLYHFDYGMFDREIAGVPISAEHFAMHIPPDFRYLVTSANKVPDAMTLYLEGNWELADDAPFQHPAWCVLERVDSHDHGQDVPPIHHN